jgi:hypothetical protein
MRSLSRFRTCKLGKLGSHNDSNESTYIISTTNGQTHSIRRDVR